MTAQEAKSRQDNLAKHYNLGHWYGTNCEKCCGVYPKIIIGIGLKDDVRYECEVCGKRTEPKCMPWMAKEAWNNHEYEQTQVQLSLF